jgi:hypothetical protein
MKTLFIPDMLIFVLAWLPAVHSAGHLVSMS